MLQFETEILIEFSYLNKQYLLQLFTTIPSKESTPFKITTLKIENTELFIQKNNIYNLDPRFRTSFIYNEDVKFDESEDIEYKCYYYLNQP